MTFNCRNTCTKNKKSNKDLKKAEIKVMVICCCYVVLGLGASIAYAIASASVRRLKPELLDYFECESTYDSSAISNQPLCDKSGYERYVSPASKIIGYSLLALYPVITLRYFLRKKKKLHDAKHKFTSNSCGTSSKSLNLTTL